MSKSNLWVRVMLAVAVAMVFCNGCAVVSSYRSSTQAPDDRGVSYYLPKKDVIVTLTVGEESPTPTNGEKKTTPTPTFKFSVDTTEAYPDIEHRFLARYRESLIGADTLKIGVNKKGLLNEKTSADFQSKLPEIMENIVKAMAIAAAAEKPGVSEKNKCTTKGSYSELFQLDKNPSIYRKITNAHTHKVEDTWKFTSQVCNYPVKITRIGEANVEGEGLGGVEKCSEGRRCIDYNGFFYRQLEPYIVEVNIGDGRVAELPSKVAIVFSPSNAPLELLPIQRGLFAKANAEFTFEDGSLTSYQQTKESEIAAITALPANVASAYFSAIGKMFELRSAATKNETDYESAVATLLLQQEKTNACMAAIAAKDDAAIEANCK